MAGAASPTDREAAAEAGEPKGGARRELCLMSAGGRAFAVYAEEVESVAEATHTAPLPFAPPAVVGVASVRGRARTVIDPSALASDATDTSRTPHIFVVALKGDEQLALAAERVEPAVEVAPSDIQTGAAGQPHALGLVRLEELTAILLDPAAIFESAMRGTERRRKR